MIKVYNYHTYGDLYVYIVILYS